MAKQDKDWNNLIEKNKARSKTYLGYPKYLENGDKLRVCYGEDLFGYTETENHGKTCMNICVLTDDITTLLSECISVKMKLIHSIVFRCSK